MKLNRLSVTLIFAVLPSVAAAQQSVPSSGDKSASPAITCPAHDAVVQSTQAHDHAKMDERGEQGMTFSQAATTHHFLLKPEGGVIEVQAKDPNDASSRDHIRMHLTHIAHAFSSGDFDIPMFVHDTVPPGVPEMKRLAAKINYTFEQTPNGGNVIIHTTDPDALTAIHKFLVFQINEHQTHDPTDLK